MNIDNNGAAASAPVTGSSRRHVVQSALAVGTGGVLLTGSGAATSVLQSGTDDRRWFRVSFVGLTATGVDFDGDSESQVVAAVADELPETTARDVLARLGTGDDAGTVEVVDPEVSVDQLGTALDASGYAAAEISAGVTAATRDESISVLRGRLDAADVETYLIQQGRVDDRFVLVIAVPAAQAGTIQPLLARRGDVRIDIYHPEGDEYVTDDGVVTAADLASVGTAAETDRIGPHVPITLDPASAERFQQAAVDTGVARSGGSRCRYFEAPESTDPCLLVVEDSEVINAFGMAPSLAETMQNGEWAADPRFVLTTETDVEAQSLSVWLQSGPLPAPVELTSSETRPIDASQLETRVNETAADDDSESTADGGSTELETPGFGIGAAVAGLGAAGALLRRLGGADR